MAATPGPRFLLPRSSVAVMVTEDDSVIDADALAIAALEGFVGFGIVAPALDSRVLIPPGLLDSDGKPFKQDVAKGVWTDFYSNRLIGADKCGFPVLHFVLFPATSRIRQSSFFMETVVKAMLEFENSRQFEMPCALRQVFLIVKDGPHRRKLLDTFDALAPTIKKYDGADAEVLQQKTSPLTVNNVKGTRHSALTFQFVDSEVVSTRSYRPYLGVVFNNGRFGNQGDPKSMTVADGLYEPITTVSFRGSVPLGCLSPVEGLLQFGCLTQLSPHRNPAYKLFKIPDGGFILPWEGWHPPCAVARQIGPTSENTVSPSDLGACIDGVLPRFAFLYIVGSERNQSYYILRDVVGSPRRELPSIFVNVYQQVVPAWEQTENHVDSVTTAVHKSSPPLKMTFKRMRPSSAEHVGKSLRVDGSGDNEEDTDVMYEVKLASEQDTSANEEQDMHKKCPVCYSDIKDQELRRLKMCGHIFCRRCLEQNFKFRLKCPLCNRVIAVKHGDMPNGAMIVSGLCASLPGYEDYTTIAIHYILSSGTQKACHPNPGQPYTGANRRAFLPACPEGLQVCRLLWVAFQYHLTFTVGRSITFGRDNAVTWNDIHHKTAMKGGPTRYGYPDPDYLTRVTRELADKGITAEFIRGKDLRF